MNRSIRKFHIKHILAQADVNFPKISGFTQGFPIECTISLYWKSLCKSANFSKFDKTLYQNVVYMEFSNAPIHFNFFLEFSSWLVVYGKISSGRQASSKICEKKFLHFFCNVCTTGCAHLYGEGELFLKKNCACGAIWWESIIYLIWIPW